MKFIQYYQYSRLKPYPLIPSSSVDGVLVIPDDITFLGDIYNYAEANIPHSSVAAYRLFEGQPFGFSRPIEPLEKLFSVCYKTGQLLK